MTVAVRTPIVNTPGLQLGNRIWRKQIMKTGDLHYQGQDLAVTPDYLKTIVDDFRSGASMDTVPFFFANEKNEHNESPELRRGNVVDLELAEDGLYGVFRLTDPADELVSDDAKFGVSVEIRHGHTDGNGVTHPAQLRHVLGTYDAIWTGLRPWEAVEQITAANTVDQVMDFTGLTLTAEGEKPKERQVAVMPETKTLDGAALEKLKTVFSDDQIAVLRDVFGADQHTDGDAGAVTEPAADEGEAEDELTAEELAQIEAITAELLDEDITSEPAGAEREPETVAAANPEGDALRLANEQNAAKIERLELANQRLQLANDRRAFEQERDRLARELGIPPLVTNLLQPILEGAGRTVRLANSTKEADAGELVRKALQQLAKVGFLDLSNPVSTAHEEDTARAESDELSRLEKLALEDFHRNR